jgi:hypothetical protein
VRLADLLGIGFEVWLVVLVLRLLNEDEKQRLANADVALARKQAGRGLVKWFNRALHECWWKVSRWSVERRAKGKESRTRAQVELHKLVHTNGERR